MKEKAKRLKLEDIKVESFVTSLEENSSTNLLGGTGDQTNFTYGMTTCAQKPGCVSWGGTCGIDCNPSNSNPCC